MADSARILIVGGYGVFGGRLVELLEHDPALTLIVAGRSEAKARAYIAKRKAAEATLMAAQFDRNGDIGGRLAELRPDLIVDASGPFQLYGAHPYALIAAAIAAKINYLDLADGSDFVAGAAAFDAEARAAGVFVLSGASSFPVLTAAVVRALSADLKHVDAIAAGIAPSPHARVGGNVIRAIASYAGRDVEITRAGTRVKAQPFTEQRRMTIAPPGAAPLPSTLFSLVDVPDLIELKRAWPDLHAVWVGAGPTPEFLHRALIGLAWLVRLKFIRSLTPLAGSMQAATNLLRRGAHRGGMIVEVRGGDRKTTTVTSKTWHLIAEGDDGPLIPSMAAAAIIARVQAGAPPAPGARAAIDALEMADYERQFARRRIVHGVRHERALKAQPLYRRLLADAWERLPPAIRAMHDGAPRAEGRAQVERGRSWLAGFVADRMGFPRATADTPVSVRFRFDVGGETWIRDFGSASFSSRQYAGGGRAQYLLCERFGPASFAMALVIDGERLQLVLRRWTLWGVPLPLWLAPRSVAYESVDTDGRFTFFVEISHWLTGLIVRYRGWLIPVMRTAPQARYAASSISSE